MEGAYKVLVCGDRNWSDDKLIEETLLKFSIDCIIQGGAKGADRIAAQFALVYNIKCLQFDANWKIGRAAGPIRNKQMLVEGKPDLVIAFHDDLANSKGTKNMIDYTKSIGKPVYLCVYDKDTIVEFTHDVVDN